MNVLAQLTALTSTASLMGGGATPTRSFARYKFVTYLLTFLHQSILEVQHVLRYSRALRHLLLKTIKMQSVLRNIISHGRSSACTEKPNKGRLSASQVVPMQMPGTSPV